MRNFQKLKDLSDYENLDCPIFISDILEPPIPESETMMILRMLVRPKYGEFKIPEELDFLSQTIRTLSDLDREITGIKDSWCYVTIRHGKVSSKTDDEWHFDGSSFRTDIIPERNYIWVNHSPTEYKVGKLQFPSDFDPLKHNLFTFAAKQLEKQPIIQIKEKTWVLLSPFCLHRRPPVIKDISRTFYRICFTDIEGRDENNTNNPILPTPFFGRNPVVSFRNKLSNYYKSEETS